MEVEKYIEKCKRIIDNQLSKEKYEEALCTSKVLAGIYYDYNQIYCDKDLEDRLLKIRDVILIKEDYNPVHNCVFFYDGFGYDLRGWAASYVRALSSLGYYVIYACPDIAKGKLPNLLGELDNANSEVVYISHSLDSVIKTKKIDSVFKRFKPIAAFYYTTPDDISAAVAFANNTSTTRFQVDLTDHAYWIGVNAFDYTIECREMGAGLALYERGVKREQIVKLDCAPYVINNKQDEPLPFDIYNSKYIFTGGALYKTLGDKEGLYYKTISYILDNFEDINFLYAGSGNDCKLKELLVRYPGRAYHISERLDFFELMKNSLLYINTYPMFGGLMMRYAALAHKIPVTLRHDNDADGILINQDMLGIEFDNYIEYLNEIKRLISDDVYREQKEEKVKNAVISEAEFVKNIDLLIKEHRTVFSFGEIKKPDTKRFREEYKNRYNCSMLYKTIARKSNFCLLPYFPFEFIAGIIIHIKERILG